MARFTMLAIVLLVLTGASNARGQDTDEVKKLKREVELLERELKVARAEVEQLKKENDQLKSGGATGTAAKPTADGFGVGTKLVGTGQRSWVTNGKAVVVGDDVEFEITKRSGTEFTAELWSGKRKFGAEVEGTFDANGVVKFKSTKTLTDTDVNLVGVHAFTGRLDHGVLTGKMTKKGDASYKGELKLKTKKD